MTHFTGLLFCQEKKGMKALTFFGAATCRGQNVSAYNVSGFIKFFLTFSTTYDTKKKKIIPPKL
jgi:hypothetical protein